MNDVVYEWKAECIDHFGEIVDSCHFDTLQQAREWALSRTAEVGVRYDLCLIRNQYSREGTCGRCWAYLQCSNMPDMFDDRKHRVPIRFMREVRAYFERV